jgi:hypothetical protein
VLGYTQWVKHEESKEDTCNIVRPIRTVPNTNSDDNAADVDSSSDVREEVVVENAEINVQNFDDQCINDKLDEMMTDVEPNFADTPGLFETFIMEKNIPLFLDCIKFSKMTATFKLYNLKAKMDGVTRVLTPYSIFYEKCSKKKMSCPSRRIGREECCVL